jgi:hypothetical protein
MYKNNKLKSVFNAHNLDAQFFYKTHRAGDSYQLLQWLCAFPPIQLPGKIAGLEHTNILWEGIL